MTKNQNKTPVNGSDASQKPPFDKRKLILPGIALVALIGFAYLQLKSRTYAPQANEKSQGEIDKNCNRRAFAEIGGPFDLINQDGQKFTDKDLLGRPAFIYFGYTMCPDVCPTSLTMMGAALEALKAEDPKLASEIRPIMISIDPERDTPSQMKKYVTSGGFPQNLIGLTGSLEQVQKAARGYKVAFRKAESDGKSAMGYAVDHSSIMYLMDRQGKLATYFSDDLDPQSVAQCIASLGKSGL